MANKTYPLTVAGVTRDLPILKLSDTLSIAGFIMLGDVELCENCARERMQLLQRRVKYDILRKSIELVKEMSYMAQTSISIRMDAELKKSFEQFCGAVGMNMSTAINMFAIACVRTQKIPFEISAQRALPGESLDLFTDTSWGEGEE